MGKTNKAGWEDSATETFATTAKDAGGGDAEGDHHRGVGASRVGGSKMSVTSSIAANICISKKIFYCYGVRSSRLKKESALGRRAGNGEDSDHLRNVSNMNGEGMIIWIRPA